MKLIEGMGFIPGKSSNPGEYEIWGGGFILCTEHSRIEISPQAEKYRIELREWDNFGNVWVDFFGLDKIKTLLEDEIWRK